MNAKPLGLFSLLVIAILTIGFFVFAQSPDTTRGDGSFAMPFGADVALAANDKSVYVVQGNTLSQVRADGLELVKRVELEAPRPGFDQSSGSSAFPQQGGRPDLAMMWSNGRAVGRGPVKLKTFPLRIDDLGSITPAGAMVHGHVTPSNHLGLAPKEWNVPADRYDVLAPADGFIVSVQRSGKGNPDPGVRNLRYTGEYLVVFEHSGTFYSYIGLIEQLDRAVLDALGGEPQPGPAVPTRIAVREGQVIGRMGGGHGLDFAVVNTEVTLKGFVNLDQFNNRDPFKPHLVDPFDYMDEPLRGKLLALNARKVKPLGGKIDYDLDGRLVGNWYREGTGGYGGFRGQLAYWVGHLTFAYHHIDPTKVTVSIGDFEGQPRQFWVKGNAPDPAQVSKVTGPVKYELVWSKLGNNGQTFQFPDPDRIHGVVLAQLLEDRKLKVEVFPNRTAAQVSGFTREAANYER